MVSSACGTLYLLTPHPPIHTALRWRAIIRIDGKRTVLGTDATERQAALRYDTAAGSMGRPTNFNKDGTPGNAKKQPQPNPEKQSNHKGVSWKSQNQR